MSVVSMKDALDMDELLDALAKAQWCAVQQCAFALVDYHPQPYDEPPLIKYTAPLKKRDFIHFKTKYNRDWWIGRVVDRDTRMTFVPSEEKLAELIQQRQLVSAHTPVTKTTVYSPAPIMRPIVFVGPSSKDSELTRLLHTPLVSHMREKFSDKLVTVKPDWTFDNYTETNMEALESEVFAMAFSLRLIFLDCDASFPGNFENTNLHPHLVYVKVARRKVLFKLLKQVTVNFEDRAETLKKSAFELNDNSDRCSLVIAGSNVDDACATLQQFLERYWAATRSVALPNEQVM